MRSNQLIAVLYSGSQQFNKDIVIVGSNSTQLLIQLSRFFLVQFGGWCEAHMKVKCMYICIMDIHIHGDTYGGIYQEYFGWASYVA